MGAKLRRRYQSDDARKAVRALALAGVLSLNRATLAPWGLGRLVALLPPSERAQFAGYLDPLGIQIAAVLTMVFLGLTLVASRRPLAASVVALAAFISADGMFLA